MQRAAAGLARRCALLLGRPGRGVRRPGAAAGRRRRQRRRRPLRRGAAGPPGRAVAALPLTPRAGARRRAGRAARRRWPGGRPAARPRSTWCSTGSSASAAPVGCGRRADRMVRRLPRAARPRRRTAGGGGGGRARAGSRSTPATCRCRVRPAAGGTRRRDGDLRRAEAGAGGRAGGRAGRAGRAGRHRAAPVAAGHAGAAGAPSGRTWSTGGRSSAPAAEKYTRGVVGVVTGSADLPGRGGALRRRGARRPDRAWSATRAARRPRCCASTPR